MATKKGILKNGEDSVYPQTSADQIVRANGERLEDADGNIKTMEVYSTGEQRIGTWIDGKPLYRKVLVVDNPTRGLIDHHIDNLDNIISITGISKTIEQQWEPLEDFVRSGATYRISVRSFNTSTFYFEDITFQTTKLTVILEYTKTTD